MRRLERALIDLSEHRPGRGADALLTAVAAGLGDDVVVGLHPDRETPVPPRPVWLGKVAVAVATTLLLVGVPLMLLLSDGPQVDDPVVTTLPEPSTTVTIPVTTVVPPPPASTTTTTTTLPPIPAALDIEWARIESPAFLDAWMTDITPWQDGYVAVGGAIARHDAAVWVSPDGITWERIISEVFGSEQEWLGGDGEQYMHAIATNGDRLVAVGADSVASEHRRIGAIWYSDDGTTWFRVTDDAALFDSGQDHLDDYIDSVVAWNGGFVAAGIYDDTTGVWVSSDGVTWTRSTDPDLRALEGIDMETKVVHVLDGSLLLVMGTSALDPGEERDLRVQRLMRSSDGLEWEVMVAGPDGAMFSDVIPGPDGSLIGIGMDPTTWLARAWTLGPDGTWTRIAAGFESDGGDIVIPSAHRPERTIIGSGDTWASGVTQTGLWGTVDGLSWYSIGRFDAGLMEILDTADSWRFWTGPVVSLLDEGSRIFAVGRTLAWSGTEEIGRRCYVDPGDGSRGSCRSDATVWIGIPAG